jgi:transposase
MRAVLKAQINKTDRNDARGLAQMMRVGLYRPVHVKTLRSQKLRMLLTHRKLLQSKAIASGENDRTGAISRCGDEMMRMMLYEAAQSMLVRSTKWSWLKAWAMKIARHRGMKKAIVALARRLAQQLEICAGSNAIGGNRAPPRGATSLVHRNSVPSTHTRCMITGMMSLAGRWMR